MSDEQLIATPGVFGENGNFLLERELGRGGMGGVYMGRDKMLDRPVAVKVMLKEYGSDPEFVEKFKREAQAAARLIHPNIAQVYSYGISGGMPYIAMELVAGGSLDGLMKVHGAAIDVPRVMKICEQVAQALRCAADQGLVHGDVKPENVLLDANGNAKLVDFGLAAMQKDTNEIWGTPYYIAPEKVKKEPVDYRADMYSLGGTIYHALTGVAPFEGDDATAVVRRRFEGAPRKPSEVRPGLSPQIDYLVMKMLAMKPQDRYPSFEALLEDYRKVMTKGLGSTQPVAAAAAAGAAAGLGGDRKTTTSAGGKKLTLKAKKKFTVHRPNEAEAPAEGDGLEPVEGEDAAEQPRLRGIPSRFSNGGESEEEEDEGVGGKVALVVGGVILAIVVVVGGLFWYMASNERAKEEQAAAALDEGYRSLMANYPTLRMNVSSFRANVEKTFTSTTNQIQSATDEIVREMRRVPYPESYIAALKPPKPKKLIDAENGVAKAAAPEGGTNEVARASGAADGKKAADSQASATAAPAEPAAERFRPPTDEEADPMSPAYKDYMKEKEEWEAAQRAKAGKPPVAAAAASADGESAQDDVLDIPPCVGTMSGLWTGVYNCMVDRITILDEIDKLLADIDEAAGGNPGTKTKEALDKLKQRQQEFKETLDGLKGRTEWTNIEDFYKKTLPRDLAKAKSECKSTVKAILKKRAEEARAKALADKIAADKERERREREALIAEETRIAKERYAAVLGDSIPQLRWDAAIADLERVKRNFKSGEGRVLMDKSIQKVRFMKTTQDVIRRNLVAKDRPWTFRRIEKLPEGGKFTLPQVKDFTVVRIEKDRNIICQDKKGREKSISWLMLYTKYHANFGDLIITFICNDGKKGAPRLGTEERAQALLGAALSLQLLCAEDPTASVFLENRVKDVVKTTPIYMDLAKEIFPDIDFSAIEEEASTGEL